MTEVVVVFLYPTATLIRIRTRGSHLRRPLGTVVARAATPKADEASATVPGLAHIPSLPCSVVLLAAGRFALSVALCVRRPKASPRIHHHHHHHQHTPGRRSGFPTLHPTQTPSLRPSNAPTPTPSYTPTFDPSPVPTLRPSDGTQRATYNATS